VSQDFDSTARGFRIAGTVLIGLVVSSRGLPHDVRVVQSLQKELDQSAITAVQQWRFEPARKASGAVAVRVTIEIRFQDL
jgi:protein TonB